ncbi:MOSC N-terminal beta barrel domain-containing protein [Luteimicrobium subarcticum]|uniref:MOSC N-terminal beta barrel domain-containing protein n=1 Tax=Luteimicrobium subarcticum TaxID=620910 RepID=UPI001FE3118D|nr:MOSC N-terminal beta barrel domain-containing protein [Luteimicrobium subarcticum]
MIERPHVAPDVLAVRTVAFTPVKGMRHLPRPDATFDAHGPVDDHRWCVVDVDRRRVLKTVQSPALLAVEARLDGDLLELVLPDGRVACAAPERAGETVTCSYWGRPVEVALTQGPHAALLSSWLGRPVRLAEAPRGGVVYGAPLRRRRPRPVDRATWRADSARPRRLPADERCRRAVLRRVRGGRRPQCSDGGTGTVTPMMRGN